MGKLFDPWRSLDRLWRSVAYALLSLPIGVVTFSLVVTVVSVAGSLLITVVLAVPVAWLAFAVGRGVGRVERSRVVALLGLEVVDPVPPLQATTWLRRLGERFTVRSRWRELGHGVLLLPVGLVGYVVVVGLWSGSLSLVLLPVLVSSLPGGTAKFGLFELGPGPGALGAAALGVVGLVLVAPWASLGVASLEGAMARRLVGSRSGKDVEAELRSLERQRAAAVDSAEAERRRIERDLHDGAQQRLVALAAELGAARAAFDTDPQAARTMVADAHEEAKAALKEIRDLVRGIHPVILEDRGLDAALSAVVARSPVPVELRVAVSPRPTPEVESTAYFVVSEALANVARHAQATRARVDIARAGNRLVVEVRDDGVGGADASLGTGLQGLRERVVALGGDLRVISPPGGPTTISVEVPCAS